MATIAELSRETGVTQQALRKFCAKRNFAKDARGCWVIDSAAEKAIREYYGKPIDVQVSEGKPRNETEKVSKVSARSVAQLSHQRIAELEAEREVLLAERTKLLAMIEHEQKMNAALMARLEQPVPMLVEASGRKGIIRRLKEALFGSGE